MRRYTRILVLLLPVPIVLGCAAFVTLKGQDKKAKKQSAVVLRRPDQATAAPTEHEVLDQLPIADAFVLEESDREKRIKRQSKNARHDNRRSREITEAPYPLNVTVNTHWWQGLAALPFADSDVVCLGEVVDSRAYLSNDRTSVYSEFTVKTEDVFKNQGELPTAKGSEVVIERSGGAVRFPSGAIQRYTTINQRMPLVGRRYVFFLKRVYQETLSLITGYELRGHHVMPLDGSVNPTGDKLPFDIFKGTVIDRFLDSIRAGVKGGMLVGIPG